MITIISNRKLRELKQLLRKANRENVELETRYKDLKTTKEKLLKVANQEASSLGAKLDVEVQKSQGLISEIKKLELDLSESKETNQRLGQSVGGLQSANNTLKEKNEQVIKENNSLKYEIKVANELVLSLQADNKGLQDENKSLIEMVRKLQNKVSSLKNPKSLEEYKNDGLSKPQKKSLKNIRKKRGN